jgi:hypothetical protein
LRCAFAGIGAGVLLLLFRPMDDTAWRGLVLLAVGVVALVIWWRGIGSPRWLRRRRSSVGPTFEVGDPDRSDPSTTMKLIREIRRNRGRQKRAPD